MKINLATEKGQEKLQATLDEVQKRCTARTVTAAQIVRAADQIQQELGITKVALDGTSVILDLNAQDFPSAYRYQPDSTIVKLAYLNGHWIVTDVDRGYTHRAGYEAKLSLSENAKNAIIQRYSHFRV